MSRVLIADDQAATRKSLTKLLQRENFEVESAADSHQLLEKLKSVKPDLVLLDLVMPGQNGTGVLEMVRGSAGHIPIVMMCTKGTIPGEIPAGAADCIA